MGVLFVKRVLVFCWMSWEECAEEHFTVGTLSQFGQFVKISAEIPVRHIQIIIIQIKLNSSQFYLKESINEIISMLNIKTPHLFLFKH